MNEKMDNPSKTSKFYGFSERPSSIYFEHVKYNGVALLRAENLRSIIGNCIVEISGHAKFLRL